MLSDLINVCHCYELFYSDLDDALTQLGNLTPTPEVAAMNTLGAGHSETSAPQPTTGAELNPVHNASTKDRSNETDSHKIPSDHP